MPLLISDANILIDMEVGELLERMFALPYEFATPDILYADELAAHHSELPRLGLQLLQLDSEGIKSTIELQQRYSRVSRYDCLALALAITLDSSLLTGDASLRDAARQEGIEVAGTLWLIDEMIQRDLLDGKQAKAAFDSMKQNGRRLPWDYVDVLLRKYY